MKKTTTWMLALLAAAVLALPTAADESSAADLAPAAAPADGTAPAANAPAADRPLFLEGEACGFEMERSEADRLEVDHGGFHFDVPCGDTVCTGGQFCCNASCSICAPRGGHCTQQICPPTS